MAITGDSHDVADLAIMFTGPLASHEFVGTDVADLATVDCFSLL